MINEIRTILDNNLIVATGASLAIPESVKTVIEILFNGSANSSELLSHEDIMSIVQATELYSLVIEKYPNIGIVNVSDSVEENILSKRYIDLFNFKKEVLDAFSFYETVITSKDKNSKNLVKFLIFVWNTHYNHIYRVSAVIVAHILAMSLLGE